TIMLLIGALVGAVLLIPVFTLSAATPVNNLDIVAFGDSLTVGVGSSDNGYVSDLERWTELSIDNEGRTGDTTEDALNRLDTAVLRKDPDIVIVLLGGNDILQDVPKEETFDNLEEIVTRIQDNGAHVILAGAHGQLFRFDREQDYQELADETNAAYVRNIMQDIHGKPSRLSDPVHPNDEGYEIMAERIFTVLQEVIAEDIDTTGITGSCEPEEERIEINQEANWRAFAIGGSTGRYQYEWDGSGDLEGTGEQRVIRYESTGQKTASVSVSTDGESRTSFTCSRSIQVIEPPLTGSCTAELNTRTNEITWEANARGGINDVVYDWEGSEGLESSEHTVTKEYFNDGIKDGIVTISSGNQSITLPCKAEFMQFPPEELDSARLSCDVESPPHVIGEEIQWRANAFGTNAREFSYIWDGDNDLNQDNDDPDRAIGVYSTVGIKKAQVDIQTEERTLTFQCAVAVVEEAPEDGGGCFIATAAFGTDLDQDIVHLRNFRDNTLLPNPVGNSLVSLYYTVSPPIADVIREHEWMREATRYVLTPVVALVQ
ncbi:MAG: CFI-box-CTERM domain-containing protein, partial [Candidatus Paceibacterota bacterium]